MTLNDRILTLSGIGHALVRLLLNAGCWVAVADVRLRRESEATINEFSHSPSKGKPSAIFVQTDTFDWAQISALWKTTLGKFGRIAIVVNSTRVHEPPSSSFWNPPGISPLAEDPDDAHVSQYKTFAINTIGPIRLAHIALATGSNTQRFRVTFYCGQYGRLHAFYANAIVLCKQSCSSHYGQVSHWLEAGSRCLQRSHLPWPSSCMLSTAVVMWFPNKSDRHQSLSNNTAAADSNAAMLLWSQNMLLS